MEACGRWGRWVLVEERKACKQWRGRVGAVRAVGAVGAVRAGAGGAGGRAQAAIEHYFSACEEGMWWVGAVGAVGR